MKTRLRFQLSGMMFLEYATWGAWMPVLSATLINRGVAPAQVGLVFAALWGGCMISPFLGGQLVDRWMPSQVFLAISHLLAAGAAFMVSIQTNGGDIVKWLLIWSLLFAPSLGITNSIAFHHIEKFFKEEADREREFSWIRTFGTIGWIVVAFVLVAYMKYTHVDAKAVTGAIPEMQMSAILGIVMAFFSLTLPNTPPSKEKREDPLAFRKALYLFKTVPGFTVFMLISFVAASPFHPPALEWIGTGLSYFAAILAMGTISSHAVFGAYSRPNETPIAPSSRSCSTHSVIIAICFSVAI
jgi:MFS family permease